MLDEGDKIFLLIAQILMSLALVFFGMVLQKSKNKKIPFLLRPGSAVVVSILVGSSAAYSFSIEDYSAYFSIWAVQFFGVVFGCLFSFSGRAQESEKEYRLKKRKLVYMSWGVFFLGAFCGTIFFLGHGIPGIKNDLEQARVDAAVEGTGYLRLMAYMCIPSSILLFAVRQKFSVTAMVVAGLFVLGLGNRSPLLYLIAPVVLILWSRKKLTLNSSRLIFSASLAMGLIASLGAYRVITQDVFRSYEEYYEDLASANYLGVATTAFLHYATVVPENAILTKRLVDEERIPIQFGLTYITLFFSALPGEQLSLDRQIKLASDKSFIGGGTPPTLMGEGYVNFWYFGTFLSGFAIVWALSFWAKRLCSVSKERNPDVDAFAAAIYGFFVCWIFLAQVAGFAGASTFPMAAVVFYVGCWILTVQKMRSAR